MLRGESELERGVSQSAVWERRCVCETGMRVTEPLTYTRWWCGEMLPKVEQQIGWPLVIRYPFLVRSAPCLADGRIKRSYSRFRSLSGMVGVLRYYPYRRYPSRVCRPPQKECGVYSQMLRCSLSLSPSPFALHQDRSTSVLSC